MTQTLIRNWWLLALCGVAEAVYAAGNLYMKDPGVKVSVVLLGKIVFAAGLCAMAAGVRSGSAKSWLLALNGAALSAFGVISIFLSSGRLSFQPVALLLALMAASLGVFAFTAAPAVRRHVADSWWLKLAGGVFTAFALAYFAMGFRWIRFEQPGSYFVWMACYFGFSALCMLALGLRLNTVRHSIDRLAS